MWLELISGYERIEVNTKAINIFGRDAAIYLAELMWIYSQVVRKKLEECKANEGYFTLDRTYVQNRTALTAEEQLQIDAGLSKVGVVEINENDPNSIRINAEKYASILVDDDVNSIYEIQKISKLNRDDKANAKKNSVRLNLVAALSETDVDVLEAYKTWITAMLEAKKPLTKAAVEIYQRNLDNYTDVKEVKIKILEIATSLAYHEFAWARDQYEKNYKGNGTFIGVRQKKANGIDPNSGF